MTLLNVNSYLFGKNDFMDLFANEVGVVTFQINDVPNSNFGNSQPK